MIKEDTNETAEVWSKFTKCVYDLINYTKQQSFANTLYYFMGMFPLAYISQFHGHLEHSLSSIRYV